MKVCNVGNLIDRWDGMANDTKDYLRELEPAFCNAMDALSAGRPAEHTSDAIAILKAIRETLPNGPACILGDAILHLMGSSECTAAYHGFCHLTDFRSRVDDCPNCGNPEGRQ